MPKKLTYEQVKNFIEEQGDTLLSKEYKNDHDKLKLQCSQGHIYWMSYGNFQKGHRCPECSGKKKLTYEQVQNNIAEQGDTLLSKEYKNNKEKLEIQCPKGHIYWMNWTNFQQGYRCSICSGNKKLTHEQVKNYIEEQETECLSNYKNAREKLKLKCPKGHIYWMSYNSFQQGHRCPECSGNKRLTNQEIIETLQIYDSIRENENEEIEVKCAYCGKWYTPKRYNILNRIGYIESNINSEHRFYCSQGCKDNCPIFNQHLYPKGYKPATSREVQPQLRQIVFERDNYTCQKCGCHKDELSVGLHCHHKFPLNENPVESADVDACITLCETCHKWIHQNVAGCGYGEMRCNE